MAFPCAHVHRFCIPADLDRVGEANARRWGFGLNTRADAASANPNAGTVEIVDDPKGGDFKTLRLDSDLNPGTCNGADITFDVEWKRPGKADAGGATNNVQQFPIFCLQGQLYIDAASFGAASTGYITILNLADSTAATDRDFELRVYRIGAADLVNRTTGPTVSLIAGTIPIDTRFRYYLIYQANTTGTNGRIVFGVSTDDGETWTTVSSTSATITNAPTRRGRAMFRAESSQTGLLDGGIPEGCYDWIGVATAFTGNGANSLDAGWTDALLIARTTYDPFFGLQISAVTSTGFTIAALLNDDDFDDAAPTIDYEVYQAAANHELEDEIPADPTTGTLLASGTITPDGTWRLGAEAVTGASPFTWYFVRVQVAGVYSPWARVRTLHTAAQGRKTKKIGVIGHIQNTHDKRPCLGAGFMAQRPLDRVICVGKRWHNDNNGDQTPGVSQAKAANIMLNAMQDVFLKDLQRRAPFVYHAAEYEGGFTNIDSRYAGSSDLMGTVDANFNYDNTGSGGDRGDNVTAGTAWTTYTAAQAATTGAMAGAEPTPGCLYYAEIDGRVKHLHLVERIYRTAGGEYYGSDQEDWSVAEVEADDGCELVVVWSASSWSDEDATSDDSYGSAPFASKRDAHLTALCTAALAAGKKLLFVSDCKYAPFLLVDSFKALVAAELRAAIVACVGQGKTGGRVPNAGYTLANWVENDAVDPLAAKSGILFAYLPLGDAHSNQNDLVCPVSGDTNGVDTDDAVMFWGEIHFNEVARTVRLLAFKGTDGQPLTDDVYGTFDFTLSYLTEGDGAQGISPANRMLLGI